MADNTKQTGIEKKTLEEAASRKNLEARGLDRAAPEAQKAAVEAHEAVTATLETGAETVSEQATEGKEMKGESATGETQAAGGFGSRGFTIPESQEVLIKAIDKELNKQLKHLKKEENRAKGGIFRKMNPSKLTEIVAKIRQIQRILAELVYMTIEALKNLYRSLFQPKGL